MYTDTCLEIEEVIYKITKRGNEKLFLLYYFSSAEVNF